MALLLTAPSFYDLLLPSVAVVIRRLHPLRIGRSPSGVNECNADVTPLKLWETISLPGRVVSQLSLATLIRTAQSYLTR